MTGFLNPLSTLAPRTPQQQCVPSMQNSFKTTVNGIPERLDRRWLMQLLTAFPHHRRKKRPTKSLTELPISIQYP
jgi:hypothetical protein